MIKIAIVDDEEVFQDSLRNHLDRYFKEAEAKGSEHERQISAFKTAIEFLDKNVSDFDIVFMDIDLPHMSGLEASQKLRELNKTALLIFITNYAQFAIDGYQYDALDYLTKPLEYRKFSMTMDKAIARIDSHKERALFVNTEDGKRKILISDISYVEVVKHDILIHLKAEVIRKRGTLKETEEELPNSQFAKCNHCYLVNLDYVSGIEDDFVVLNSAKLKISRNKKKEFTDALTEYLGESK